MSREQDDSPPRVKGRIVQVHDDYVVVYPTQNYGDLTQQSSVTFSLQDWKGKIDPQHSQMVWLDDVAEFSRGWRANSASPVVPSNLKKGGTHVRT